MGVEEEAICSSFIIIMGNWICTYDLSGFSHARCVKSHGKNGSFPPLPPIAEAVHMGGWCKISEVVYGDPFSEMHKGISSPNLSDLKFPV